MLASQRRHVSIKGDDEFETSLEFTNTYAYTQNNRDNNLYKKFTSTELPYKSIFFYIPLKHILFMIPSR